MHKTINVRGSVLSFERPLVMGIINVTPDSFYADSRKVAQEQILGTAGKMLEQGADILDVGAYSSRPGATDISTQEEQDRLGPAISILRQAFPNAVLSADTFRASVAQTAAHAGADIVNDISGGSLDEAMFETVAALNVPYILMHMRGTPQTMKSMTAYEDLVPDMLRYFSERIYALRNLGVKDIIIDPGFGFAKTATQSYQVLDQLESFRMLGYPILAGLSRKSMISSTLGIQAKDALNGTSILNTVALQKGASILRVHDVVAARECVKLLEMLKRSSHN